MKPFKAVPILKEKIWGGHKLKQYNKSFGETNIGESWETDKDTMPIHIKLIDANDILSVQVHPNDSLAWELEKQRSGKSEAWIVLDCDDDTELIAGIKLGTTQYQLEEAIKTGNIQQFLNRVKVKKGDCIYIPAGTVHCLGKGMLVYEVQQPSDLTYRLYDWDRMDDGGKPRELHIQKAIKGIDYNKSKVKVSNLYELCLQPQERHIVFQNQHFVVSYIKLEEEQKYSIQSNCFIALTIMSGSAWISAEDSKELMLKGDTLIIPEHSEITLQTLENSELIIAEESKKSK